MASLPKQVPSTVRTIDSATRNPMVMKAPVNRPYLVHPQIARTMQADRRFLALFPHESEDARLTGDTRSLHRRLLALNVSGTIRRIKAYTNTRIA